MAEHESKGARTAGPLVREGFAHEGGLNEAPGNEKPQVAPAPQRRVLDTGAHGGIYVNPPPAGPPPTRVRGSRVRGYQSGPATGNDTPSQGGTGETARSGDLHVVTKFGMEADKITMATPYKCPVCGGRGILPPGFYHLGGTIGSGLLEPETCRTCNGSGVIWDYGPATVFNVNDPCVPGSCKIKLCYNNSAGEPSPNSTTEDK